MLNFSFIENSNYLSEFSTSFPLQAVIFLILSDGIRYVSSKKNKPKNVLHVQVRGVTQINVMKICELS